MKKHMIIVGCEVIEDDVFRLSLMELTTVTKMERAEKISRFKKLDQMNKEIEEWDKTQKRDTIFISVHEWHDCGYKIGRHVTVELLPDDTTGEVK